MQRVEGLRKDRGCEPWETLYALPTIAGWWRGIDGAESSVFDLLILSLHLPLAFNPVYF